MENNNPLQIYCKNCGAPAGYDIVHQTYRCAYCGETSGIDEVNQQVLNWRRLTADGIKSNEDARKYAQYACKSCGARVIFEEGEASETCEFCGSKLIRRELSEEGVMPELIIPFFITPEEAKARMLEWGKKHLHKPEGRAIVKNIDSFKGAYLPYRLVKGPVSGSVSRDSTARKFNCAGYIEGSAVLSLMRMDNSVLNAVEPFDWTQAKPFEYGYIAGHKVMLENASGKDVEKRVLREIEYEFLPEVEKLMQTKGVDIDLQSDELVSIPVLLPVYYISFGKLTAAMNGQTGRICADMFRYKKTFPWVVEPLFYTVLLTVLLGIPYHFAPSAMFLFAAVFSCIFFAAMGDGRASLVQNIILRSKNARARRENDVLKIEEGRDILRNPFDNTPVFFENNKNGERVPVKIKFYSFARWIQIVLKMLAVIFLPVVIAAPIRLLEISDTGEPFTEHFNIGYGAAWYVLAFFIVLIYWIKGVRSDVYNHPILYEIKPDGSKKLMGKHSDRKIGLLSLFGVGEPDENGKRIGLIRFLIMLGGIGAFLGITILVIIIGCVAAILD